MYDRKEMENEGVDAQNLGELPGNNCRLRREIVNGIDSCAQA